MYPDSVYTVTLAECSIGTLGPKYTLSWYMWSQGLGFRLWAEGFGLRV